MSDTPKTDALREVVIGQYKEDELTGNGMGNILAALTDIETLERERDEARDESAKWQRMSIEADKRFVEVIRERDAERALAEQMGRLYDTAIRQLKALESDLDRLEADLAAERALADRLAEAIQNYLVLDENIDATTDELNGSWEQLQSSITAWKEARSD